MAITDWPSKERPREKLLEQGAASLSDAELLTIFLRTGTKGKSAMGLARELLTHYGGLGPLLSTNQQEFCSMPGLGPAKYAQLQAVLEIAHRHLKESIAREDVLTCSQATRRYLRLRLDRYPNEVFACLFLDNQHRIICYKELFQGTIDGTSVHPREVIRMTIQYNAAAVIFAHNHPSGIAEPSKADESITVRLKTALSYLDVRVLDHVIIGQGTATSMAELGMV